MDNLHFESPDGYAWELETTHHGLRPLTPYLRTAYLEGGLAGTAELVRRAGLPLASLRFATIHGCTYVRPEPLDEADPIFAERAALAEQLWELGLWRKEVDDWFGRHRGEVVARNLELQGVDLQALDNAALAQHLDELVAHFAEQAELNMACHGGDLLPAGDYLAACAAWGIEPTEAAALLGGSSPASVEATELLAPVAEALAGEDTPGSLDALRARSPECASAVDRWLEQHAWRLVTSDDIDRPTLVEAPALHLAAVLAAATHARDGLASHDAATVRRQVPEDEQERFDGLLEAARYGLSQRDDVRGVRWNWPAGLVRRGVLEAGRRLLRDGALHDIEHVVELEPAELRSLLTGHAGPTAETLAGRARLRDRIEHLPPPRVLGEPEEPPPLDGLPPAMARSMAAIAMILMADGTPPPSSELSGVGIGATTRRGRAVVAKDAVDAVLRVEPGDVLVVSHTGPSLNCIFPLLGALVVEEGGTLCHAAISAREFGLTAVIGAVGAVERLHDGAVVEVDPVAGTVHAV